MTMYFVECYWPGVDERRLAEVVERLADDPLHARTPMQARDVAWLSSILIPDDEIVLCVATGSSAEEVRATAHRAGLPVERVVGCVQVSPSRKDKR